MFEKHLKGRGFKFAGYRRTLSAEHATAHGRAGSGKVAILEAELSIEHAREGAHVLWLLFCDRLRFRQLGAVTQLLHAVLQHTLGYNTNTSHVTSSTEHVTS